METILEIFQAVLGFLSILGLGGAVFLTINFIATVSVDGIGATLKNIKNKFSFKNRTLRGYRKEVERLQEEVELVEEIAELERKKRRLQDELKRYGINTEK